LGHLIEFCALHNVSLYGHSVVTLSFLGCEVLFEEAVYPDQGDRSNPHPQVLFLDQVKPTR
jgi:hypothetical protein